MGSKWVLVLVISMFVSLQGCLSQISGCWEEERVALLQLKHFFNDPNSGYWVENYEQNKSDWPVEGERNNSDCCQWKRVECNNSTGRVISLYLLGARGWGIREGYLNASLFSAFEQLEALDLSENYIAGFVDNGGLDKLSTLTNLEFLNLRVNMFNNDILSSLNALQSLTSLYLYDNRLNETVDLQGLDSCKNLKVLDIGYNHIEKVIFPKGLDKLSTLTNLEYLDLGDNMFNNDILSSINALPSLKSLYLTDNRLNETVDLQGLDSLRNLEDLSMGYNPIEKFIFPKGSTGLRKLKTLDLSGLNVINGSSLLQSLGSFPSLKTLYLNGSKFSDSTTNRDYLHNLTNVEELMLDGSFLHISLLQSIAAFTSLNSLSMLNCHINGILGLQDLPNFKNLTHLYMDDTSLNINFLQIVGEMTSLEFLSLSTCRLQCTFFHQGLDKLSRLRNLEYLDLRYNMFNNDILSSLNVLPSLKYLYLDENRLNETVDLQGLDSCKNLKNLSLSYNQIEKAVFPKGLDKLSTLTNLEYLDLGGNMFNNDILSSINALPSLKSLDLSDNRLNETVDLQGLHSYQNLTILDLSNNQIEKVVFPKGLDSLEDLDVRFNPFEKFIFPKGNDETKGWYCNLIQ